MYKLFYAVIVFLYCRFGPFHLHQNHSHYPANKKSKFSLMVVMDDCPGTTSLVGNLQLPYQTISVKMKLSSLDYITMYRSVNNHNPSCF